MAVPAHLLCNWRGVYGSPAAPLEEWSFSIKFEPKVTDTVEILQGYATGTMEAAWTVNFKQCFPPDVVLTETRAAYILGTGLTATNSAGQFIQGVVDDIAHAGVATGANPLPLQTALCVSLVTARSGPTGKGRFYTPTPGVNLDANHTMPETAVQNYATLFAEAIADLQLGMDRNAVVASSKGYLSPVTGVRIGRVLDTMRSRREGQAEGYLSAAL